MKITKKLLVLVIAIMFLILLPSIVHAAGDFSISASQKSIVVGKTATLTIKTTNAEGKFSITSSNPNVVSVAPGSVWAPGNSVTLTAKSAGTATITVTATDVSDTDLNRVTGSKSVTITVANNTQTPTPPPANTTKSGDATLKSITIGGKTFSGSALNSAISYTVPAATNSIKISATKNNSKATVSGTGTKSLVIGQTNKFQITVTAENGTKKTYSINVIRLAEESTIPNIIDEGDTPNSENVKLMLTSLIIKDVELNSEFNPEVYTYIANTQNMKQLEIDAAANKTDAKITIEGATDLKQGDNIVKIIVTLGDEKVEYVIDVYNTVQDEVVGTSEDNNGDSKKNEFMNDDTKITLLIIMICLLGVIAIRYIVLSYILNRKIEEIEEEEILLGEDIEEEKVDEKDKKDENTTIGTGKIGRHF